MLISIIIPTRNRFEYVKILIEDILKQNIFNYEIIVVDQSDIPKKLENCHHIITDTRGPCASRNIGVKNAKGKILVFLDDDARINSDFIHEITSPILEGQFYVVAGAVCNFKGDHRRTEAQFLKNKSENFIKVLTSNPDTPNSRICISFPSGCSAISKNVFDKVGGFDELFDPTGAGEDRDMALKLYMHGYPIWYNANAKLLHLLAPVGGTRDLGSRTLHLDVHTYIICKKYFSPKLADSLKATILNTYRKQLWNSILKFKNVRTRYRLFLKVKKLLKSSM